MRPFISLKPIEQRVNGEGFLIDSVPLIEILALDKTPLYVTSLNSILLRAKQYKDALSLHFPNNEIFYAMKANFSKPIIEAINSANIGVDIVSVGEWRHAVRAGTPSKKICFAGVGKKDYEWQETILGGLGYLSVEHLSELNAILDFLVIQKRQKQNSLVISIRINPAVEVDTHPHLRTGALNSKFGILYEHFQEWLIEKKNHFQNAELFKEWLSPLKGIHVHIGSQLMESSIFPLVSKKILDCAQFMFENQVYVKHIDFGGGLGVPETGVTENGSDIINHVNLISTSFKVASHHYPDLMSLWGKDYSQLSICLEPGRSIVASSTVFITKVLYEKRNSKENLFCYVDGAMNDFPRPSIYGAFHHAEVVNFRNFESAAKAKIANFKQWNIVGPVCESGDFLAKNAPLPDISAGDIVAFFEAGAYCRSMASQYNLRDLPSEVFVRDGKIIEVIQ